MRPKAWLSLVLCAALGACSVGPSPRLSGCQHGVWAPNSGSLAGVSEVAGVVVDSARWRTGSWGFDVGVESGVIYEAYLSVTRRPDVTPQIVFRGSDSQEKGWIMLRDHPGAVDGELVGPYTPLRPGAHLDASAMHVLRTGLLIFPAFDGRLFRGCPVEARVIAGPATQAQ